jgi:hypothetical protein
MLADVPAAFTRKRLGGGIKRRTLILRMAVNEIEDAV